MDRSLVYGPLSKPFLYHDLYTPARRARRIRSRSQSQSLPASYFQYRRLSAQTRALEQTWKDRGIGKKQSGAEEAPVPDHEKLYTPSSFHHTWDTKAYLECFYKTKIDDPAMQMVMFYFPNFLAPIPKCERALDFGAGPTIHVAMMMREKVLEGVWLADYLPQNRHELELWKRGESEFNWGLASAIVNRYECCLDQEAGRIEPETRAVVKDILHCDIYQRNVLPEAPTLRFDIVTTFFCVEYSCLTEADYKVAIANIFRVIKPGGYFIMGGVMEVVVEGGVGVEVAVEVTWCSFGGRCFASLYLTRDVLFQALRAVGVDTDDQDVMKFKFLENDGMFMVRARKPDTEDPLPRHLARNR